MPDSGFSTKRVYEDRAPGDGYRVLVDRLWPRGLTKEAAELDEWNKVVAPSDGLRRWVHEDLSRWAEFSRLYVEELRDSAEAVDALVERAGSGRVTLVYAARDTEQNHANVLRLFLESKALEP